MKFISFGKNIDKMSVMHEFDIAENGVNILQIFCMDLNFFINKSYHLYGDGFLRKAPSPMERL